jgi:hypothetical protein
MPERITDINQLPTMAETMAAAMEQLKTNIGGISIAMSPGEALAVFSHLQLALRHPGAVGASSELARKVAMQLQTGFLAEPGTPLARVLENGWDAAHDVAACANCAGIPDAPAGVENPFRCRKCKRAVDSLALFTPDRGPLDRV